MGVPFVSSCLREPGGREHGEGVDQIDVSHVEEERHPPKYHQETSRGASHPLGQREDDECRAQCHQQE